MASSLPEELVQEILVHLPADEPVHPVRASIVCKAWRRAVSGDWDGFLRRCREFHGAPPPLGYIQNLYSSYSVYDSTIQFVPIASPVLRLPAATDCSGWYAVDSRHGRVLIHDSKQKESAKRLIVWDIVTGSLQHLSVPGRSSSYRYYFVGAVLCAKDKDVCDHIDCHGGPFIVVVLENRCPNPNNVFVTCARIYSSETNTWSALVPNGTNRRFNCHVFSSDRKHNLLVGDALYFPFESESTILKYDLRAHSLSKIDMPQVSRVIIMKAEDGGLGLATLQDNCLCLWSRQDFTNGIGEWVMYRVMELATLLPRCLKYESYNVICFVEDTNTIFVKMSSGLFTLDLESKKVKKIESREAYRSNHVLPYTSFYVPR